jgi:chromosome segregation protein
MRFKHLSLQGYKSFANKSEFLFLTGITAVVGPNGSGKSNIADGIRWVMGEQRMSSLRGKSTEDMIYAGGRKRARAGMAEVSLTFDNSDSWLPIEFSEVTITRRAYRSGGNEYLINGARVRLRDIAEMLAQGGLSQRTYTVIGQGLVDAALSLRPQERRELFEEAAGITVYRKRRQEALKRLEDTHHNLERVHDIIREISPRLRRLEREVERVRDQQRLVTHLERLQRTWYGYHWGQHQASLARAIEKAAYLQSSLDRYRQEATGLSEQLVQQRRRESELRAQLRDWYRESADTLDRANETQRETAVNAERKRLLEARREELHTEIASLEAQRTAQSERLSQARAEVERAELDATQLRQRLATREREWVASKERIQGPAQERARVEQTLRERRADLEAQSRAVADERAEAARIAGEMEALRRVTDAQQTHSAGAEALMEAGLDGVLGPLAALIEVPAQWERAIEAALGPDLEAIVVERAEIVKDVQRVLELSGGRVTLLPLDSLRPASPSPAAALYGSDVVTCDTQVRPVVDALLGRVILCDSLPDAQTQLPTLPTGSYCALARGVVFRADGAITISEAAAESSLVDQRVGRDLPTQLERTRQHCLILEKQQQQVAQEIEELEQQLQELDQRIRAAEQDASRVEQETVAGTRMELAVAEETLRSLQAASGREEALLGRFETQIAARLQRIEELDAEHTSVTIRTNELRAETARLQEQIDHARERIQPSEDELTQLGQAQTAIEERERIARDRMHDAETRHGRSQLEVDRCQDELELLARRIEEDLGLVELSLADSVTAQAPLPLHPVVSELPIVQVLPQGLDDEIQRLKARLRRVGDVNPAAPDDYAEVSERFEFLNEQSTDLEAASGQLKQVVSELDELMEKAFRDTFDAVAERFEETFTALFSGGAARLELTDPDDMMNTGVDIVARPPGKRAQRLALLSGGERSLTAVALLFAILQVSPAPFCVLDEVDAMLDEANVGRFRAMLEALSEQTQFIIITHNRGTVEAADTVYGVSMGTDGVSQIVSLRMDQ